MFIYIALYTIDSFKASDFTVLNMKQKTVSALLSIRIKASVSTMKHLSSVFMFLLASDLDGLSRRN